jgi:hypothetical protein
VESRFKKRGWGLRRKCMQSIKTVPDVF